MILNKKAEGYGIFFDPTKSTSGQRFFSDLYKELAPKIVPVEEIPKGVLFNVSVPLKVIIKAKLRRQKIILRIDSLYFDELSTEFLSTFGFPLRMLFTLLLRVRFPKSLLTELANLIEQNYSAFIRILLSDLVIYQSEFSKKVHQKYFPEKPNVVIVNGTNQKNKSAIRSKRSKSTVIKLVTIYDEHRPSKRIKDIIDFIKWVRFNKNIQIELTILGYSGKEPNCLKGAIKREIEKNKDCIKTIPRFKEYNEIIASVLDSSDIYISFSYRDACPNAIIEAMSFGLPVIGIVSGGIPDIVGNAGELIPGDDFKDGFFSPHRFSCSFPSINFESVFDGLKKIVSRLTLYEERVECRFKEELDIRVVAEKYDHEISEFLNRHPK